MMRAHSSRSRTGSFCIALLLLAIAALPSSAAAMRSLGNLSPGLAKLESRSLRNASAARQAKALGLTPERLARRGRRILVNVRFEGGALAARGALREAGGETVTASGRYQTVTVAAAPGQLHAIADLRGVASVAPVLSPILSATCPSGTIVSEGDTQLRAKAAREANPGIDGTGTTVGILSDSFDQATEAADGSGPVATHAEEDVESGDLPGANTCANKEPVIPIGKDDEEPEPSDEGRAMTQIVHDLAPGAKLKFASAFNSETEFADNIRALASGGADVIADDVFYPEEPFFQDGPIAVAVREATEEGATYFSAAGNDNLLDEEGHDIASWETPEYRDAESCPPSVQAISGANAFHCLDFNPGGAVDKTFGIRVEPESTLAVDLQWDEPWLGVDTDLDAFLLNSTGGLIRQATKDNAESQIPAEILEWLNTSSSTKTVQLAINRFSGDTPRVKFAFIQNGGGVEATEYPRSSGEDVVGPTIFGHSGSASAISVGAVPFASKSSPEPYSSHGPVRHDWGPVEGTVAASPIAPEALSKPDLVATDCGGTTFFAFFEKLFGVEGWHFCGTSAAAPHAAAVAALMLDAEPAADPEDIRAGLVSSAKKVGSFGPCAVGAGLAEAVGALEKVLAHTGFAGPTCEPPESEVEPAKAAAPGNWGSEAPPPVTPTGSTTTTVTPTGEELVTDEAPQRRPRTFFRQRPGRVVWTHGRSAKVALRFGSDEASVLFACRIDGGFFRPCAERLARRFSVGSHSVLVIAHDAAGNGDRTPAALRFKVKHVD
jgi:subtilase family protein